MTYVEYREIVDSHHAAMQVLCDKLDTLLLVGAEDARAKAIPCAIRNFDGFLQSVVLHDSGNRRKH